MSAIAIRYHLLLVPPSVVFKARINQATFTSAAASVTYDGVTVGAYTDLQREMLVLFGTTDGASDAGRARVRTAATADTLNFGWASRGVGEGEAYLQDDLYITVLDLYKPWTRTPRITDAGVTYTDYDRDFATYGALPPVIVLGCGPAVQQPLDAVTDLATFTFDASASYITDADATALSTYAWTLPAGATLTAGAVDSSTVTFTLPESAAFVHLTVTDDAGTTATRHVLCVAGEPTGTLTAFDQIEITRRPDGQTLRVRIGESIPPATYPNGCMAVLWKSQTADGAAVTPSGLSGHEHLCFVGWHYMHDANGAADASGYLIDSVLEFRDVGGWLQVLPGYPMVVQRKSSPTIWSQMRAAHIDRYFVRLLAEYANVLDLTDFTWSGLGDTYPFPSLQSEGQTLYEQVDGRAQAIVHKFTCDQWGRLAVKPDPQLIDPAGGTATPITRTATVQKAFTDAEYSDLAFSELPFPRVNWNRANAIVAAALGINQIGKLETVWCTAPGKAPSQGTAPMQSGEQLVTGQDELNAREGYRYAARMNNPLPSVEWTHLSPDDFAINPAAMEWVTLTTSAATADARGRVFSDRLLPIELTLSHDGATGLQTVRTRAEWETTGTPAQTYIPPDDDGTPEDPVIPPAVDPGTDLGPGLQRVFLIHASGEVSITSDFQTPGASGGPSYTVVDLSLDGDVLDAVTDPYSPLYIGTGTTVNAWIVTTTRIYHVADIAGVSSRVVTSQHTFTDSTDRRTIQTERAVANWVIVASYYLTGGTTATRTTDGSTWTEATVSSDLMPGSTPPALDTDLQLSNFTAGAGDGTITATISADGYRCDFHWWGSSATGRNNIAFTLTWTVTGDPLTSFKVAITGHSPVNEWFDSACPENNEAYFAQPFANSSSVDTVAEVLGTDQVLVTCTVDAGGWDGTGYKTESDEGRTCPSYEKPWDYEWTWQIIEVNEVSLTPVGLTDPTLAVSGHLPGLAYVGAVDGSTGDLFRSRDYGATWDQPALPGHDFGTSLGGCLHLPWHDNADDMRLWSGKLDAGTYEAYEAYGPTLTDRTPASAAGPNDPKAWATCALNRQIVALMADDGTFITGYRSITGGASWTTIQAATIRASAYVGVHLADDGVTMFFLGPRGVGYSSNGGTSIDDRIGDGSASEVVCVGGW